MGCPCPHPGGVTGGHGGARAPVQSRLQPRGRCEFLCRSAPRCAQLRGVSARNEPSGKQRGGRAAERGQRFRRRGRTAPGTPPRSTALITRGVERGNTASIAGCADTLVDGVFCPPHRRWAAPLPSSLRSDGRARADPVLRPPPSRPRHELPRRGAGGVGGGPAGGGGDAGRAAHGPAAPQHRQVPLQEGGHLLHRHRGHAGRGLRLHRLRLRPGLLRGAGPGPAQGGGGVQGCAAQLGQRWDGADFPGVLPEEEVALALLGRVHPLGAVDHQGERGEPGQRAGAADLPREGGREALREDHQHRGGDEPPRVPAQDAHPVGGGQRLRHQPEGCAALPLQDLLPDHGHAGHLGHHHHAPPHQGHSGPVGATKAASPAPGSLGPRIPPPHLQKASARSWTWPGL